MQARGMSNYLKVVATNSIIGWSGVVVHIILRDVLLQNIINGPVRSVQNVCS